MINTRQLKNDERPKVVNLYGYIASADVEWWDGMSEILEMYISDCGFRYDDICGIKQNGEAEDFPSFPEWLEDNNEVYTVLFMGITDLHLAHKKWKEALHHYCFMMRDKERFGK